eukprot:gene33471-40497_t
MSKSLEDMKDLGIDAALDRFLALDVDEPVANTTDQQAQPLFTTPQPSQALPYVARDRNADILAAWEEECELMEEMQNISKGNTRPAQQQLSPKKPEPSSNLAIPNQFTAMEIEDVEDIDISMESTHQPEAARLTVRHELAYTQVDNFVGEEAGEDGDNAEPAGYVPTGLQKWNASAFLQAVELEMQRSILEEGGSGDIKMTAGSAVEEVIIDELIDEDKSVGEERNSSHDPEISIEQLLQQFSRSSRFASLRSDTHAMQRLLPTDDNIYSFEEE